jgi:nucleotide-binding universal stress UspA family protein
MLVTKPTVVVGVDGTSVGTEALRVGLREATLRGCAVEVVTCWHPDRWYRDATGETPDEVQRRAQLAQEEALKQVLGQTEDRPVLSRRVIEGPAGATLVKLSKTASFLVVGTHQKSVVERSVLGSVSEHCVRHSRCPVIVVPAAQSTLAVAAQDQHQPQHDR